MSAPILECDDKILGALNEAVSAMSALNMHPEPMAPPQDSRGYLSEVDAMAAHAIEHLRAVVHLLREAHRERECLRERILRLEILARSARQ